jgi:hypothetical protein
MNTPCSSIGDLASAGLPSSPSIAKAGSWRSTGHATNEELLEEIAGRLRCCSRWPFVALASAVDARDHQEGTSIDRTLVFREARQRHLDSADYLEKKGGLQWRLSYFAHEARGPLSV